MGLSYIPARSLHSLNCIRIPEGVDDAGVRKALLTDYGIEIGVGSARWPARRGVSA